LTLAGGVPALDVPGSGLLGAAAGRTSRSNPGTWTLVDRDYEKIRIDMQTLLHDLGIRTAA
jgi:hypothetical protein